MARSKRPLAEFNREKAVWKADLEKKHSGAFVTGLAEYGVLAGLPDSWKKETAFSAMSGTVPEPDGRGKKGEVGLLCSKHYLSIPVIQQQTTHAIETRYRKYASLAISMMRIMSMLYRFEQL